jgi:hypothetical protein
MIVLECSCGLCRRLLTTTIPVQHRTLPEEGYDAASYLVGYGGSGHTYALHLHFLRFICIKVLCWLEVDTRNIVFIYMRIIILFIYGYSLFIVYHAHYMFMEISMDKYYYHEPLFSMTCILLYYLN